VAVTAVTLKLQIVYQNGGFYSCLECIAMVVSGVRGAVASDGRSVSDSQACRVPACA